MTVKCGSCGYESSEPVKFCPECGVRMPGATELSAQSYAEGVSLGAMRTLPEAPAGGPGGGAADVSLGGLRTMAGPSGRPGGGPAVVSEAVEARYELLEEIGRGGFASVWKARDKKLGRMVALKRLMPDVLSDSGGDQTLARFRREAEAIARMNHRNIVSVYDRGEDAKGPYIVMELVEGGSLRGYVREHGGKLPVEEAVRLVKGVAQGLSFAHRNNLVHRDVKPANVLLHRDPTAKAEADRLVPKLVDFGLARAGGESELSMSGYGMGTPYYMPPEQRRDAKSVNHTADIYALGKTLYELVSGEVPDNVDPSKIPPVAGLSEVIFKCVKSSPSERFFSADELLEALDRIGGLVHKDAAAPEGNPCASCGAVNVLDAKYCEACGAGMVRVCPECGRENSVNKSFCAGCGTSQTEFAKASDALARMEKSQKEAKPGRVVKEFQSIGDCPTLRKTKGSALMKRLSELHAQAQKTLDDLAALREKFQKATDSGDFAQAISLLSSMRGLDPGLSDYDETLAHLKKEQETQLWNETVKIVESATSPSGISNARKALAVYLKMHPDGSHVQDAKTASDMLDARERADAWQKAGRQVASMVAREAFQDAADLCRQVAASLVPSDEQRAALAKAKELDELASERRDMATWEGSYRSVRALVADGSLGSALLQLRAFLGDNPGSRMKERAQAELDDLSARYDEKVSEEMAMARKLYEDHQLLEAVKKLDGIARLCGGNASSEVKTLRLKVEEGLRKVVDLVEEAKEAAATQDYDEALSCMAAARKLDVGDASLEPLEGQYGALLEKQRVERIAMQRRRVIVAQTIAALVVIGAVGFFLYYGFWTIRFRSAVARRDLVGAAQVAKWLPGRGEASTLDDLQKYQELNAAVAADMARLDTLLEHYEPETKRNVANMIDLATKTPDVGRALSALADARIELAVFGGRVKALQQINDRLTDLMAGLGRGRVARLMPDTWTNTLAAVKSARALDDIGASQRALQAVVDTLPGQYRPLDDLQAKYDAMVEAETGCVSALGNLLRDANVAYVQSEANDLRKRMDDLRAKSKTTLDFAGQTSALGACLADVTRQIQRLESLRLSMSSCSRNRADAEKAGAASLLEKPWAEVEAKKQAVVPELGPEEAVRRLNSATAQYAALYNQAVRLSDQRTKLLEQVGRIGKTVATIRAKPLAGHVEQDLQAVEAEVKGQSLDAAASSRYDDVGSSLARCEEVLSTISEGLSRCQIVWARFLQLEASLAGDVEILTRDASGAYAKFEKSRESLKATKRLADAERLLGELVRMADDLSLEADKLRRASSVSSKKGAIETKAD